MKVIFRLSFFLLWSMTATAQSQNYLDSLKTLLANTKNDSAKVELLNKLSFGLGSIQIEQAESYGKQALTLATKISFKKGLCQAHNNMGIVYDLKGEVDSALVQYMQSLEMAKQLKNIYLQASSFSNIGFIYWSQGDYNKALDYTFKALHILDTGTNYVSIASTIEHVAMIYYDLKDYPTSIKFHRQAIAVYGKANNEADLGGVYCNLALNYLESNKDSMIYYLKKAEVLFIKYDDHWGLGHVYNNIGGLYVEMKKPDPALLYLTKARKEHAAMGDEKGMVSTHVTLAMAWLLKDRALLAKNYLDTAVHKSLEMNMQEDLADAYRTYALVYARLGILDSVTHYLGKENAIKDTLFSSEKTKAIADMQTKYDSEKKDLEIAKHKTELLVKEKEAYIKNSILAAVFVLLLLLSGFAYLFYRKKQIEQKARLDSELSKERDLRIKSVVEAEEKERRRIAQDLHDGIGQILSAAKLNLSSLESTLTTNTQAQKDALKNTLDLIDDSVREVRTVSHSMMPNTLIKLGLASAVKEFITKMGSLPNLKIDLEIVGLDKRLEENTETAIYRAVQEIVTNIVKHAKANKISIQLIRHATELSVVIEDNGVGFDVEKINEFEGIGLKNILSRIEFINGTVHFDSLPGRGTTVIMDVPIS